MTWKSLLSLCLLSLGLPLTLSLPALANNIIISDLSGTVEVDGFLFLFWSRAQQYQELDPGDRLRIGDQSSVTLLCQDANRDWVTPTISTPGEIQVRAYCAEIAAEDETGLTRAGIDESLPYIITPRNTALRHGTLDITWNAVPDANTYRVRIRGIGFSWESDWLTTTETTYTASLEAGRTYEISVETDQGVSSNPNGSASPTFRILTAAEVSAVNQEVAQIEALALDPTARALAVAQAYRNYNLNQDAIAILETQIQSGTQNTALYQLQASLYEQIGLTRQAQERYKLALGLTHDNDLEQRAEIQESLGSLARSVANHAEAIIWLQAAEANYRQLLDASLPEVQDQLRELDRLIEDSQSRLSEPQSTTP